MAEKNEEQRKKRTTKRTVAKKATRTTKKTTRTSATKKRVRTTRPDANAQERKPTRTRVARTSVTEHAPPQESAATKMRETIQEKIARIHQSNILKPAFKVQDVKTLSVKALPIKMLPNMIAPVKVRPDSVTITSAGAVRSYEADRATPKRVTSSKSEASAINPLRMATGETTLIVAADEAFDEVTKKRVPFTLPRSMPFIIFAVISFAVVFFTAHAFLNAKKTAGKDASYSIGEKAKHALFFVNTEVANAKTLADDALVRVKKEALANTVTKPSATPKPENDADGDGIPTAYDEDDNNAKKRTLNDAFYRFKGDVVGDIIEGMKRMKKIKTRYHKKVKNNKPYPRNYDCADISFLTFMEAVERAGINPNQVKFLGYDKTRFATPTLRLLRGIYAPDIYNTIMINYHLVETVTSLFDAVPGNDFYIGARKPKLGGDHSVVVIESKDKWVRIAQGHFHDPNRNYSAPDEYPDIIYLWDAAEHGLHVPESIPEQHRRDAMSFDMFMVITYGSNGLYSTDKFIYRTGYIKPYKVTKKTSKK